VATSIRKTVSIPKALDAGLTKAEEAGDVSTAHVSRNDLRVYFSGGNRITAKSSGVLPGRRANAA
jgi:hypothetical protein